METRHSDSSADLKTKAVIVLGNVLEAGAIESNNFRVRGRYFFFFPSELHVVSAWHGFPSEYALAWVYNESVLFEGTRDRCMDCEALRMCIDHAISLACIQATT